MLNRIATRVQWKDAEWNHVCVELHKRFPIETQSSTLAGIKSDDVLSAMKKVLSEDRWRSSMNMTQARPKLIKQFTTLRRVLAKMDAEKAEHAAKAEREDKDKAKDALEPLAELLAERMFAHLRPMIDEYLQGQLAAWRDKSGVVADIAEKLRKPMPRERKVRVGIIGLLPIQANSLAADFPQFEFTFIKGDNSHEVRDKMANMDTIFGLTPKMGHNVEGVLKKMPVWGQYRRVGGKGTSAVKQAVRVWAEETV